MNRERFEHLLAAYGADFARWPDGERAAGEAFARSNAAETAEALSAERSLDDALTILKTEQVDLDALMAKVIAGAPRARPVFDRRAMLALAACAVFGVLIGYGGGLLAPAPEMDEAYFAMALEAPWTGEDG